jgi:hypothetical protein
MRESQCRLQVGCPLGSHSLDHPLQIDRRYAWYPTHNQLFGTYCRKICCSRNRLSSGSLVCTLNGYLLISWRHLSPFHQQVVHGISRLWEWSITHLGRLFAVYACHRSLPLLQLVRLDEDRALGYPLLKGDTRTMMLEPVYFLSMEHSMSILAVPRVILYLNAPAQVSGPLLPMIDMCRNLLDLCKDYTLENPEYDGVCYQIHPSDRWGYSG